MTVTKQSMLTGVTHTREIDISQDQFHRWQRGELIQNVCPQLSSDDREFLISGATPEEWAKEFGSDETDSDNDL